MFHVSKMKYKGKVVAPQRDICWVAVGQLQVKENY
jgi:hypothetical protein